MDKDVKKIVTGAATVSGLAAVAACGAGLVYMALWGATSATHFFHLGMAVLGAAMIGAVIGVFVAADTGNNSLTTYE